MIKRITYECELCHSHYGTAAEAEACEAVHIPMDFKNIKALYRVNEEYPYRLVVDYDNNVIAYDVKGYMKE